MSGEATYAMCGNLYVRVLNELDGRVSWLWPGLISRWARTSEVRPNLSLVRFEAGWRLRMWGRWGPVRCVAMGHFATVALGEEALCRVKKEMSGWSATASARRESFEKREKRALSSVPENGLMCVWEMGVNPYTYGR